MAHDHSAHVQTYGKAFAIGIGLNIAYVAVEIIYGLITHSSALFADAGHNASDVLSLIFAWLAMVMAQKQPSQKYTYGLRRSTILVSILNALLLFGAAGVIGWEAWQKFFEPVPVAGTKVMIVAGIGVIINTATALLFMKGQKDDLNIKGAFLHMAADAGVSLGVVGAGLLINITSYNWIDPVTSFLILLVIVYGTWQLFVDSVNLALDAVPQNINLDKVMQFLENQSAIRGVHDLHIWGMSTTENALSVHLVGDNISDEMLQKIKHDLHHKFEITHTTIQTEQSTMNDALQSKSSLK